MRATEFSSETGSIQLFDTEKIRETKSLIQENYYHFSEKSKKEIEDAMITSLVESLGDKHSSYFAPKEATEFKEMINGDFEGIGAVIDEDIHGIKIRKVFPTSPADTAWLKDGDVITRVGDFSVLWVSAEEAVKKIRGPKGSKVQIQYIRPPADAKLSVTVTRDTIVIPSTQERMLTGSLGYIEIAFFGEHTTEEFQKSLERLTASGAKGLILDFRNNGGWYLDTAVDILSYFFPEHTNVVTTRENDARRTLTLSTAATPLKTNTLPIVLLVNSLSASASEIVAGALQDHKRAIIVGETTYGKGSVQTPFVLTDGSIVKLTIGKWFTPKDRSIDAEGIKPDIVSILTEADYAKQFDRQRDMAVQVLEKWIEKGQNIDTVISKFQKP